MATQHKLTADHFAALAKKCNSQIWRAINNLHEYDLSPGAIRVLLYLFQHSPSMRSHGVAWNSQPNITRACNPQLKGLPRGQDGDPNEAAYWKAYRAALRRVKRAIKEIKDTGILFINCYAVGRLQELLAKLELSCRVRPSRYGRCLYTINFKHPLFTSKGTSLSLYKQPEGDKDVPSGASVLKVRPCPLREDANVLKVRPCPPEGDSFVPSEGDKNVTQIFLKSERPYGTAPEKHLPEAAARGRSSGPEKMADNSSTQNNIVSAPDSEQVFSVEDEIQLVTDRLTMCDRRLSELRQAHNPNPKIVEKYETLHTEALTKLSALKKRPSEKPE